MLVNARFDIILLGSWYLYPSVNNCTTCLCIMSIVLKHVIVGITQV